MVVTKVKKKKPQYGNEKISLSNPLKKGSQASCMPVDCLS